LRLRSDSMEFSAFARSTSCNNSSRAICLPQNSYHYYRGDWGRMGKRGRHLLNKRNLLDGNCNIKEKELKLQNRDNAI
jgi:hypothetical protein